MDKTTTIDLLSAALAKAQVDFKAAALNSTNPFFHSKYADLGAVIEAVRPALARHGLSFMQLIGGIETPTITTMLLHESGQWISDTVGVPIDANSKNSASQVYGIGISYMRRYTLASMLGIYTDEDTDGNEPASSDKPKQQSAPKATPTQQAATKAPEPNGQKPAHPYDPDTLRNAIKERAEHYKGISKAASDKQKNFVRILLDQLFAGNRDDKHTWMWFMFDLTSSKELTDGHALALLDWMKPVQDSGGAWVIDSTAQTEAKQSLSSAVLEKAAADGQQTML